MPCFELRRIARAWPQVPFMVGLFLLLGAVAAPAAWTLSGVGATAHDVIAQACGMMALHTREPSPVKNEWVERQLRCEELARVRRRRRPRARWIPLTLSAASRQPWGLFCTLERMRVAHTCMR